MRRVVNSYAANRTLTVVDYLPEVAARAAAAVVAVPNYGWLLVIMLTFSALSVSTMLRSRGAEQQAVARKGAVEARYAEIVEQNDSIRWRTEQVKSNPRAGEAVARQRLRQLNRNEAAVRLAD